ncbi:putative 30S ribosomal protein S1 [Anaerolinea thermophila UNI-1]|uniref:30S ribosomal protein S1 n=2 Tax=Anaerolinea thermophila TaxID=167964 RepID=E8N3K8_ANATU|nr:putative 30S ribosomal protein S1 [Anaerolinea thermophila UNI-1]
MVGIFYLNVIGVWRYEMAVRRSVARAEEEVEMPMDEGWWASVLADEQAYGESLVKTASAKSSGISGGVNWARARQYLENDEVVKLEVYGFNRGGLLVRGEDIQGFVPVSHLVEMPCVPADEEQRRQSLANYVGRILSLKVIECEMQAERIVFSERAALAGEGKRRQLFSTLRPGEIVNGTVTNVTDFGAFVDLGGLEGLIHVSELSWGRVQHPTDILQVGVPVRALVLSVSAENGRVALSLKRLCPNPWETLPQIYRPGDVVEAEVTAIMRFGAFARLKEGVEGLIHISTMSLPDGEKDIEKFMKIGQKVQVRILHLDAERRRLGLGLVQIE